MRIIDPSNTPDITIHIGKRPLVALLPEVVVGAVVVEVPLVGAAVLGVPMDNGTVGAVCVVPGACVI